MSIRTATAIGLGGLAALFLSVGLPALLPPQPVPTIDISEVTPVAPTRPPGEGGDDDALEGDDDGTAAVDSSPDDAWDDDLDGSPDWDDRDEEDDRDDD
jgi:hypothetical protein